MQYDDFETAVVTAWRKATARDEWQHIVNTATLQWSTLSKKKKKLQTQLRGINFQRECSMYLAASTRKILQSEN